MALPKQLVPIPLGVGLDTKSDPKQIKIGKLSVLENRVFTKIGKLTKRFGLTALSRTIAGSSLTITSASVLSIFQKELNVIDATSFYTRADGLNAWVKKADVTGAAIDTTPIIRNNYEQLNADVATSQGLILYAWEDSSGGVRASLYDAESKQAIISSVLLSSTGSRPKCSATASYLYVHFADASNKIKVSRLNPQNPSSFDTALDVATDANATPFFDVVMCGSNLVLGYRTSSPSLKVGYIKPNGQLGTPADGFPLATSYSADATSSLALQAYFQNDATNDGIYFFYHNYFLESTLKVY